MQCLCLLVYLTFLSIFKKYEKVSRIIALKLNESELNAVELRIVDLPMPCMNAYLTGGEIIPDGFTLYSPFNNNIFGVLTPTFILVSLAAIFSVIYLFRPFLWP